MPRTYNKTYNTAYLLERFNKMSHKNKVTVLHGALTYMEMSNSRTQSTCIIMAMGYEPDISECDMWHKKT